MTCVIIGCLERRSSDRSANASRRRLWRRYQRALIATLLCVFGGEVVVRGQSLDVLYSFKPYRPPSSPDAALLEAADGRLYGTTRTGGAFGYGILFRLETDGSRTDLHSFDQATDGSYPQAALVQASNGSIYGTTNSGGPSANQTCCAGGGTVFRLDPDGSFHVVHAFGALGDAGTPTAIIAGHDGNLYGIADRSSDPAGTLNFAGVIYRMSPAGTVALLHVFAGGASDGQSPSSLIQGADGDLYGSTWFGGAGGGTVFRMATDGAFSLVYSFSGALGDVQTPQGGIIQGRDGNLYGSTSGGGTFDDGTVFKLTPSGTLTVLYSIGADAADGFAPHTALVEAIDGTFYGSSSFGGASGRGAIFGMSPSGTIVARYSITDVACDGPRLMQTADGRLLGTICGGGDAGLGSIVRLGASGTLTTVHQFGGASEGFLARGAIVQTADGTVFGTTCQGGIYNRGTIYRIGPSGTYAVIHAFKEATEGACPTGLAPGSDGVYGTTSSGGAANAGTAFRVLSDGTFTLLHTFAPGLDGANPSDGGLLRASDGNFYGTTTAGGSANFGTLFRLTPGGAVVVLHSFSGAAGDGTPLENPLVQGTDGNLYGSTSNSVFQVSLSGSFAIRSSFSGNPIATALVESADGSLYGIARYVAGLSPNTSFNCGRLVRIASDGAFSAVAELGCAALQHSLAFSLAPASGGAFYAVISDTTSLSGSSTLYRLTPNGSSTPVYSFGANVGPVGGPLLRASNGDLLGATSGVWIPDITGIVFRLRQASAVASPAPHVSMSGRHTRLDWAPVSGAIRYAITRVLPSGVETTIAADLTGTSFIDTDVVAGQRYRYVVTAVGAQGQSASSYELSITPGRATRGDFDGDHRADIAVYRPHTGSWFSRNSGSGYVVGAGDWHFEWGAPGDRTIDADFDGDGRLDPTVYRPGTGQWFVLHSTRLYDINLPGLLSWGATGDIPFTADFDNDGQANIGVFRPANGYWYIRHSSTGYPIGAGNWLFQWGGPGDQPFVNDFDGDGQPDITVFRPSTGGWFIRYSTRGYDASQSGYLGWGAGGDTPLAADFDGDGKTDVGIYRPSTGEWQLRLSTQSYTIAAGNWIFEWGAPGDEPKLGDFDGDGLTDITVYRPSTGQWFIRYSSLNYDPAQFGYFQWGATGDVALPQ